MGTDVSEVVETQPPLRDIKVHNGMCTELSKLIDRIGTIFPEIEAARPRCSSGIQALCLLNSALEKARSLIQHCSESSKLYLALTADSILSRCKRTKSLLEHSLSQIQNMVPIYLAAEISQLLADLKGVTFTLDPAEDEAGKALKVLLQQYKYATGSTEKSAIEGIRFAALKLHITSQKALLIERRCIKKLLDKLGEDDHPKKNILLLLLGLLKHYAKSISKDQSEDDRSSSSSVYSSSVYSTCMDSRKERVSEDAQTDLSRKPSPPEEFKCFICRNLMYDPVIIASGETFERMWIQKWFNEGHDTCPKTKRKLEHMSLTPNTGMKCLISKWCFTNGVTMTDPCMQFAEAQSWSSTSIDSLSISMKNLQLPVDFSSVSIGSLDNSHSSVSSYVKVRDGEDPALVKSNDSHRFHSCADKYIPDVQFLHNIHELPWESQCKAVEDVNILVEGDDQSCHLMLDENFVEPLIRFLNDAHDLCDMKAQRVGCLLLLAFVRKCRSIPHLNEDAYRLLASLLNAELVEEALAIIEVLSCHHYCRSEIAASGALTSIMKILETHISGLHLPAIKVVYNLTLNSNIHSIIISSELIPKLVPFIKDVALSRYCIAILKNLCDYQAARDAIAKTEGCISSIVKLIENGNCEEQELAVAILISLCSQTVQYCRLVMDECVIPMLMFISVNGSDKAKANAMELLRLLREIDFSEMEELPASTIDFSDDSNTHSKEKKITSRARIFGKLSLLSRSSLAVKGKK